VQRSEEVREVGGMRCEEQSSSRSSRCDLGRRRCVLLVSELFAIFFGSCLYIECTFSLLFPISPSNASCPTKRASKMTHVAGATSAPTTVIERPKKTAGLAVRLSDPDNS
jgi:hypothetical protein